MSFWTGNMDPPLWQRVGMCAFFAALIGLAFWAVKDEKQAERHEERKQLNRQSDVCAARCERHSRLPVGETFRYEVTRSCSSGWSPECRTWCSCYDSGEQSEVF